MHGYQKEEVILVWPVPDLAKRLGVGGADVFFHLFPTLSSLYFLLLPFSSSLAPPLLLMEAATSGGLEPPQPPYWIRPWLDANEHYYRKRL